MNYHQILFQYVYTGNEEESLSNAEKEFSILNDHLKQDEILTKHAYSWPDGSFYKFVCSNYDESLLKSKLTNAIKNNHLKAITGVQEIYIQKPTDDPNKVGCATLEEYFKS